MFNFEILIIILCICVLPVCMRIHFVHAWYPQRPENGMAADPVNLELYPIVSHHVSVKN